MLFDYPQPLQVAQVTCLRSQIHKHLFEKKRVLKRKSVLQEEGTVHQKKAEQPSQKKKKTMYLRYLLSSIIGPSVCFDNGNTMKLPICKKRNLI